MKCLPVILLSTAAIFAFASATPTVAQETFSGSLEGTAPITAAPPNTPRRGPGNGHDDGPFGALRAIFAARFVTTIGSSDPTQGAMPSEVQTLMTLTQGLQPSVVPDRPVPNPGAVPHKGRREDASSSSYARTLDATTVPKSSIERHCGRLRGFMPPATWPLAFANSQAYPETSKAEQQHRPR